MLLGAGGSARMGRPKLLLPWGKTSVIGHLIEQWEALAAEQIAVVCAAGDRSVQAELDRLGVPPADRIWNAAPERGMFSSIQCAAQWGGWKAGLTHWAIALGDQPHLRGDTLKPVVDFSAAHPERICLPRQGGHRRHPVLLPRLAFLRLANSTALDLRSFLDDPPTSVLFCDLEDPALELDIDRPEDYEKAAKMFFGASDRPFRAKMKHKKS